MTSAVLPRPRPAADPLLVLGFLLIFVAILGALFGTAPAPAPAPVSGAYLDEVTRTFTPAPGYTPDVVAAGWIACGDLGRGATPGALVDRYAEYGIGGDLYSRQSAAAVVDAAQHVLCPR